MVKYYKHIDHDLDKLLQVINDQGVKLITIIPHIAFGRDQWYIAIYIIEKEEDDD